MNLRQYQNEFLQMLRESIAAGYRRIVAVLPTGAGKTFVFSHIVKGAFDRGRKILIITNRTELLTQSGGALNKLGLNPIEIVPGKTPYLQGSLYSAMVETLNNRLKKPEYQEFLKRFDIIIIDECHLRTFDKLFQYFREDTRVLGFTATPKRMGAKNQMCDYYQDMCVGVEIDYLIERGFLAYPTYYGVPADLSGIKMKRGDYDQQSVAERFSQQKLYAGVVRNWEQKTPGTKTLVFSSNIENSLEVVKEFESHGYLVRHLDATMPKGERKAVLNWFKNEPKGILCNVGILTTGFDEPSIETIVLYRATKSVPLFLQMCGRGSRVIEGIKDEFTILDFGNNITNHGYWHNRHKWNLNPIKEKDKGEAVLKNCPVCEAFILANSVTCKHCGHVYEKLQKEKEIADLKLLLPEQIRTFAETKTISERVELAKAKLINPYWVLHKVATFEDALAFVDQMGWSRGWMHERHERFWWSAKYLEYNSTNQNVMI